LPGSTDFGIRPRLVVDYWQLGSKRHTELTAARRVNNICQEEAVAKMLETYEILVQMFWDFDFRKFHKLPTPEEKFKFLPDAADYVLSLEDGAERFILNVKKLLKLFALSVPNDQAITIRDDVAFFQSVNARILKLQGVGRYG